MKQETKHTWIAVALLVAAGCVCAVAASLCRAMCRLPYLTLGAPASPPQQAAQA